MIRCIRRSLILAGLVLCASSAFAQTPTPTPPQEEQDSVFGYIAKRASLVSGVLAVDGGPVAGSAGTAKEFIEVRFVDDFALGKGERGFRGVARLSLFALARSGESLPPPSIPTTIEEVTAFSDAELWLALYKPISDGVALECLGGVTAPMTSITGKVGNPLDGTRWSGACGARAFQGDTHLTLAFGSIGTVAEGGDFGFIPSMILTGYVPMPFAGTGWSFVPDLAVGVYQRTDPLANRKVSYSFRVAIAKEFAK